MRMFSDLPEDGPELGSLLASYSVRRGKFLTFVVAGSLGTMVGLTMIVGCIVVAFVHKQWHLPHLLEGLVGGAFLTCGGSMMVFRAFRNRGLRVLIFPEGLVRLAGEEMDFIGWDEVRWVRRLSGQQIPGGHHFILEQKRVVIRSADGREFEFDETLSGFMDLRWTLEEETLKFLLPAALQSYRTGETIAFGDLLVSPQGLGHGTQSLTWDEVQEATIRNQLLTVCKKDQKRPWLEYSIGEIPNRHLLKALLGSILGPFRSGET